MKLFSYLIFLLVIAFLFMACETEVPHSGRENEGCKSDKTCDRNLYCNLEKEICEPCSITKNVLSSCDEENNCLVPSGEFCMGCQELEGAYCKEDELPYHKIFLKAYKIDKYEVSVADFKACVDAGACKESNLSLDTSNNCNYNFLAERADHPINCVNWHGAKQYCHWKGKRLPTEAEWEKAARGSDGRAYPWTGNSFGCKFSVVDLDEEFNENEGCAENQTWLVSSFEKDGISPYGLVNMSGNVMEWVNDFYSKTFYTDILDIVMPEDSEEKNTDNPVGPTTGNSKVLRGGGWRTFSQNVYTFRRDSYIPAFGHDDYGFRCASDIESK